MVNDRIVGLALDEYASVLCDLPNDGVALRNASMNLARACGSSLGFDGFRVLPVDNRI
ncbi:hypothetical protein [Aureimonas jatrophae]|uniref:Uncharacterized protein n=1 Tax=Aureimonas jatrophae TaxID=1166073 RepID=A0A1H0M2U9_9HYPH|nr:hypothetical protein [Aureimonas jatrophae]MBB3952645.1 hypothetical protein [Aureimonas jatrophae]SDO74768.1 hypothetical protein SAMN05192530_11247 [Aureimonas jatrophae]